jgi:hypothetical protein
LIEEISADEFDCTYAEWTEHLRDEVGKEELTSDTEDAIDSEPATIERRPQGWIVKDKMNSYLVDPDYAEWVVGEDQEMPPAYFDSAEEAKRAYIRSERVGRLRVKRREEALRRLGKL